MVVLFGAPPDTGNLGVSALCRSVVDGLLTNAPGVAPLVFDHGRGRRRGRLDASPDSPVVDLCGASHTRRLHRRESLTSMYASSWAHLPQLTHAGAIAGAAAALDISGGDSFTDLYGPHRFRTVILPKLIAIRLGTPLVLMPQTYGPFENARTRERAAWIVRRSAMAWARDERSFATLRELLGDAFDPQRHRAGVDVAFGMRAIAPDGSGPAGTLVERARAAGRAVVGMNISGLIWNDPESARDRYKFRADYRAATLGFLTRLLERESADILLVPHVLTPTGHYESDADACDAVRAALAPSMQGRVHVLRGVNTAPEIKGVIAECDWFCGTRMHATIAGLSSGVPTAAIAYSLKTAGVFETCGVGDAVVDPRDLDTHEVIERLWDIWEQRSSYRDALAREAPRMARRAADQMALIVGACGLTRENSQP